MTRLLPIRTSTLALLAGLAIGATALTPAALGAPDGVGEELPIQSITLYRSGVGAFDRRGLIAGDADVTLKFDADQINDILKSMIVLDLSGGQIESVSYGSREPLARRLASFGINLSNNPSMYSLLGQLRGTKVRLGAPEGTIEGTVFGVETRDEPGGGFEQPLDVQYVTLLTDTGLRTLKIAGLGQVEILDKQLSGEVNRALAAMAEQRTDSVKTVDIALRGEGAREVVVGYVHEMPVWKASYRLVLPDFDAGGDPTVQGWAIVENTTDEDWRDVQLSLVAGRPVSFVMDLYEPLYLPRPEVPVPAVAAMRPKVYAEGKIDRVVGQAVGGSSGRRARAMKSAPQSMTAGAAFESVEADGLGDYSSSAVSGDQMAKYAAASQASAVEVGAVFQYQLSSPVTIERRRSAMLPILSAGIEGRRVSIYDGNARSEHPMTGVELTNTTGLQLMPGPVSVYDDGTYAGDAQIGHITEDAKRLLSYAVDLDVKGKVETRFDSSVLKFKITHGVLQQSNKQIATTTYKFDNGDDRGRVLLVEHHNRSGFKDITPEPAETTKNLSRYEIDLDAGGSGKLVVREQRTTWSGLSLLDFDHNAMMRYARQGKASDAVVKAFERARELRAALKKAERRIANMEKERRAVDQDQKRIRDNMGRIDRNSDLYRRYMTKLNDQETFLENLAEDMDTARKDVNRAHKALNDFVSKLTVN